MRSWLLALAFVAGCRSDGAAPLVFAAVSTSDALSAVAASFDAEVRFAFGSSSDLARQIGEGAPAEVFLSADEARLARVERHVAEQRPLLGNHLVIIVQKDEASGLARPEDLAKVSRLALADPSIVPAGVYARAWLTRQGLWDEIAPRVIPTLDVRAAASAVASGAAQAAIVYSTDAERSSAVRVTYAVPELEGPRIVYPVALMQGASPTARRFYEHLSSPAAAAIFRAHGFSVLAP